MRYIVIAVAAAIFVIVGCNSGSNSVDETNTTAEGALSSDDIYQTPQVFTETTSQAILNSRGVYVTSQCYTKTEDDAGVVHNPCFTCHIDSSEPNYINDWDLQQQYAMGEITQTNPFTNLFKDRTAAVETISDEAILAYVRTDNYFDADGRITLAEILKNVPQEWDYNSNGEWNGYTPDCYFDFDREGFDKNREGNYTGWRAFGYYPFLGTFWPTNGSTDDVLIRLPKTMQQDENGTFNLSVYKLNLAIVEALIKQEDITIEPTDETKYGVDLNQNGIFDTAKQVVFHWTTPDYNLTSQRIYNFSMYYVGKAKTLQISNDLHMAPGLYPEYTEFLHTVRYIDLDSNGTIKMAKRMKELRYGVKTHWNTYGQLKNVTASEIKDKDAFPNRLRTIVGNSEYGLRNAQGWSYMGYIEDVDGYLRPQTYEETLYCIGCHSGIGAIADSTFVFQRKFDYEALQNGWYHWTQSAQGLKGISEPTTKDGRGEYTLYLERNHAGDEFRENSEVMEKFFDTDGTLDDDALTRMQEDISHLLYPSQQRALQLNKAYKAIVDEQSFIYGRDAHVKPAENVYRDVIIDQSTGIVDPVLYHN